MSAPDFYFVNNAMFRHIHDRYGMDALVGYWRSIGEGFYATRAARWKALGTVEIARDWIVYFAEEPQADVQVTSDETSVDLDVRVCPAIKHLRDHGRDIVPYFCNHCDEVTSAMVEPIGYRFERTGGMGSCRQRIVKVTIAGKEA
jgi:hypothetical protein